VGVRPKHLGRRAGFPAGLPRGKNIYRSLFGTKCPGVTVPQGDAGAVESLKQRHDDPSAASDVLAQLTNRRRSVVSYVLADQFGHALQTLGGHHHFRVDLYSLACLDQEPQCLLRGNSTWKSIATNEPEEGLRIINI
jgi:hypothetical protein